MTRPPPSLLPGSDGTRSPGFNRYYEAAKTTGRIWRHSVCHVAPPYLGLISSVRSPSRGNRRAVARVLFDRSHPLLPVFCPKDAFGSPKFPVNPSDLCHALRPRLVPGARSTDGARIWSPSLKQRRHRHLLSYAARSPGFSHHCLRFVPSSRTTTQNSLPVADRPCRVGFSIPTEFGWRVSHFSRSPLPGLILARSNSHSGRKADTPVRNIPNNVRTGVSALRTTAKRRGAKSPGSARPSHANGSESASSSGCSRVCL